MRVQAKRRNDGGRRPVVLAIAAHPDDIEFLMAGTLLRFAAVGWEVHYFNVCSGSCGSRVYPPGKLRRMRLAEAREAAGVLGAVHHAPVADDLEVVYGVPLLRRVGAVVRRARPSVVLTHSLEDYMEDHMETARLAVTAAFARGMRNFGTLPPAGIFEGDVTVYHAMPHGLRDGMRRPVVPELFVNTEGVHEVKLKALGAHRSQQEWLDASQGMNSFLAAMDEMSRVVGGMSGVFRHAEGWRRHSHLGFCGAEADPLREVLFAREGNVAGRGRRKQLTG